MSCNVFCIVPKGVCVFNHTEYKVRRFIYFEIAALIYLKKSVTKTLLSLS